VPRTASNPAHTDPATAVACSMSLIGSMNRTLDHDTDSPRKRIIQAAGRARPAAVVSLRGHGSRPGVLRGSPTTPVDDERSPANLGQQGAADLRGRTTITGHDQDSDLRILSARRLVARSETLAGGCPLCRSAAGSPRGGAGRRPSQSRGSRAVQFRASSRPAAFVARSETLAAGCPLCCPAAGSPRGGTGRRPSQSRRVASSQVRASENPRSPRGYVLAHPAAGPRSGVIRRPSHHPWSRISGCRPVAAGHRTRIARRTAARPA